MQKNNHIVIWLAILGILLYAAYDYYNNRSHLSDTNQSSQYSSTDNSSSRAANGKLAPEIALNDLSGQSVKLSNYRGKVVILNFWASWCPPCKSEMPELDQAARAFASGSDAVLLTVNLTDGSRETAEKAAKYIAENQYCLEVLLDTQGQAANTYRISSIPTTYIIDKKGVVIDHIVGPTTKKALDDYVNQLK